MINFHCTTIPVVVLDSVITHTSALFLDREIHQLVVAVINPYSVFLNFQFLNILVLIMSKFKKLLISKKRLGIAKKTKILSLYTTRLQY